MQKLSGATSLNELFHITERFFWGESERRKRRRYLYTSLVAHKVGGLVQEWFTFIFLVNAQLLLRDITVGVCEHFLVRISVKISVRKYQKSH